MKYQVCAAKKYIKNWLINASIILGMILFVLLVSVVMHWWAWLLGYTYS